MDLPEKKPKKPRAKPKRGQKVGRPTKYDPKFCQKVIAWGKKGMAPVQWAAELMVSKQVLIDWCKAHPEFLDAYEVGMSLREAWLVKQSNNRTTGKNRFGSDTMIKFMLAANHGYREKLDLEVSGEMTQKQQVEVSFASLLSTPPTGDNV